MELLEHLLGLFGTEFGYATEAGPATTVWGDVNMDVHPVVVRPKPSCDLLGLLLGMGHECVMSLGADVVLELSADGRLGLLAGETTYAFGPGPKTEETAAQ